MPDPTMVIWVDRFGRPCDSGRHDARKLEVVPASERKPTHVCLDCGALGYAGGYHDHGGGAAGETVALKDLPGVVRDLQRFEVEYHEADEERDRYREALERIEGSPRAGIGSEAQRVAREALRAARGAPDA